MAILDLKWPQTIDKFNGIKAGGMWQDTYYDPIEEQTVNTIYYHTAKLTHVDLSDFDSSIHTINNPLGKDLFTFPNGTTFTMHFYWYNNLAWCLARIRYHGVELPLQGADYGIFGGLFLPSSEVMIQMYGFDFAVYTDYSYQLTPVEGITEPQYLLIRCFAPGYNGDARGEVQISEDATQNEYQMNQVAGIQLGYTTAFYITDLESFNTWFKTQGHGTDEDVYKKNPPTPEDDESGTGGGGGQYDPTSDPIDFPDLPIHGTFDSGVLKAFLIDVVNLGLLQNKMWDMSAFDIPTRFQKMVESPIETIVSLKCVPVIPENTGTSKKIYLGNFDTDVSGIEIINQWQYVDCGSLNIKEVWGSFLDYSPFSHVSIYLPFIGIVELKPEDVQKSIIHVKYMIDLASGDSIAFIKCGQSVLYSFNGNIAMEIPLTSYERSTSLRNTMFGLGSMVSGSGAGAMQIIESAVMKPDINRGGNLSGNVGIMGFEKPFLIWHRPKQSLAKDFKKFSGYPSNITYQLSQLSGYTEVEQIHLEGITNASDEELAEIEALLKSGVIL